MVIIAAIKQSLKEMYSYLDGIEKKDLTEKIKIIKEDIIEI